MVHHDSFVVISSSPDFPSICDLLPKATKKNPLRSGSNAAPVPDDASVAFMSAASMWQSSRALQSEDMVINTTGLSGDSPSAGPIAVPMAELPPAVAAGSAKPVLRGAKSKPQASAKARKTGQMEQSESRDAATEPRNHAQDVMVPPKKTGKKPRSTKDPAMAQTTLPTGKVTKPAAKEKQPKQKPETVSRHFAHQVPTPVPPPELTADPIDDEPVILEPAMRRRMDWTPPRESASTHCLVDSSTTKASPSVPPLQDSVFKTLQATYGLTADADAHINTALSLPGADILGKRKLIEMAAAGNKQQTPEVSPTKPKAVKKKPRTITELATAAYRRPEEEDVSAPEPGRDFLVGYLEAPGEQVTVPAKGAGAKPKASRRVTKPKASKKKVQAPKPILLSPTSAMRQVAKQDFVFGTASQLAIEDDPALLRALHEAMKESNQADSDPFASPSPVNGKLAIRRRSGAGLWTAGARYGDGDLLSMEVLDLTGSSPLAVAQLPPKASCAAQDATGPSQPNQKPYIEIVMSDDSFDLGLSPPFSHAETRLPCVPSPASQATQLDNSSPSVYGRPQTPPQEVNFEPPPSNQEQHQILLSQSNSPRQDKPAVPPPPNFDLYTDARLAKEVASFGFKVVKKRTAMIALLNQCWESRNKTTLGSRTTQTALSTSSVNHAASPSLPKGRPGKKSVASASDTEAAPPAIRGAKKSVAISAARSEGPQPEKRPRGRPRKNSTASVSDVVEAPVPAKRGRRKSISVCDTESDGAKLEKRPRGRPKKAVAAPSPTRASKAKAKATASQTRAKSPPKTQTTPAPSTPRRRRSPSKQVLEIPDSDSDDPFASTQASSPEKQANLLSSPPAMDLSVTEDTEASLVASPTTQQVSLFRYITEAVVSAPPATDPAEPSWHEKMLMYDPVILEDLTAWLNAGQLDKVGYEGEVAPRDVKKWCESKSVCCLWRVNLRGQERKRF